MFNLLVDTTFIWRYPYTDVCKHRILGSFTDFCEKQTGIFKGSDAISNYSKYLLAYSYLVKKKAPESCC